MAGHGQVCPAAESRHSKQLECGRAAIGLPRRAGRGRRNEDRDPAAARNDFTNRNQSAAVDGRAQSDQTQSNFLFSGGFRRGFETKIGEGVSGERGQGDLGRAIKERGLTSRPAAGSTDLYRNFQQRVSTRAQH